MRARELQPLQPVKPKPVPREPVTAAQLAALLVLVGVASFAAGSRGTVIEVVRPAGLAAGLAMQRIHDAHALPLQAVAASLRPGEVEDPSACAAAAACCPGGAGSAAGASCSASDCQGPGGTAPCAGTRMRASCPATCARALAPSPGAASAGADRTLLAAEICHRECTQSGFCCNDYTVGSNQYLSCAQACMARARGASEEVCEAACHEPQEGCTRAIEGFTYQLCAKCTDLRPACPYGVMGTAACSFGCTVAPAAQAPQRGYRFATKRGRNVGDCDGLYTLSPQEGLVRGKPVYLNAAKAKFLAFDGAAWVVAALPYLPYARAGSPVIGYHAGGASPDGEWADYTVTAETI